MERKQRNILTLGAIGGAIGLFIILGAIQTQKSHKTIAVLHEGADSQQGLPSIGGAFELIDKDGKIWKDTDFKGKPTLVYFGYTYCPDICPTALSHLTQAVEALGGAAVVQPIFITLDPLRDTPSQLQIYGQNFHQDFVMLTGSQAQVDRALKAYRVHAAKAQEKGEDYLMDHSSIIYFMKKDGTYYTHFNHQTPPAEIVEKVKLYLAKGE